MEINNLIENHPGDHRISFEIVDTEENIKIDFNNNHRKVNIDKDFIKYIEQIDNVFYKLN